MVLRTTILVAAPLVVVAEIGDDERNARAAQEFAGASSQIQKNPPVAAGSDNSDYWKALGNENKVDAKELAKWYTIFSRQFKVSNLIFDFWISIWNNLNEDLHKLCASSWFINITIHFLRFTSADTFTGDTTLKGAVDADDTLEGQKLVKNWPLKKNLANKIFGYLARCEILEKPLYNYRP